MDLINSVVKIPEIGWKPAFRGWQVTRDGWLRSVISNERWYPGEVKEAGCVKVYMAALQGYAMPIRVYRPPPEFEDPCAKPPTLRCACGIWALKEPMTFYTTQTSFMFTGSATVFGLIEISGRIVEGSLGYRAQLARLKALMFDETLVQADTARVDLWAPRAAERYGVPLVTRWADLDLVH